MIKPFRFETTPKLANSSEAQEYGKMSKASGYIGPQIDQDGYFDANNDGEKEYFTCNGQHIIVRGKLGGVFQCGIYGIMPDGKAEHRSTWQPSHFEFDGGILDFRYGDIDKDGDIDIAFSMKDTIYVYHNLINVSKPQTKPTAQANAAKAR